MLKLWKSRPAAPRIKTRRRGAIRPSDAVGSDRGKAIELNRCIAGRVSSGRKKLDAVADLQVEWQLIGVPAIEDVAAVAGRSRQDDGAAGGAIARRADAIMDTLRLGFR